MSNRLHGSGGNGETPFKDGRAEHRERHCDVPFAASGFLSNVRKAETELKMRCCGSVEILWLRDVRC